ncbi:MULTISPECIES: DUF2793 domain-containing protein [Sphingomonas]|uniref:DUF2793 domain-containing protein n=1 Tax=Sphingomonas TaxID=13687 RepID=UPI00082E9085|nr:DUF2793 domain-containing protein [Sphingomonas sp. CCH10-B3]
MTDETTARLALPLLQPGQAQKELYHNEALALLDFATQAVVEAVGVDMPPAAPAMGACWVVGSAPVGGWTGQALAIAGWTGGGWRFVPAREGMTVWNRSEDQASRFDGIAWRSGELRGSVLMIGDDQLIGPRRPAIGDPAGGATVDIEAREAVTAILTALRGHGLIEV